MSLCVRVFEVRGGFLIDPIIESEYWIELLAEMHIPIRRLMDVLSAVVSSFCHDSNFKKLKNIMCSSQVVHTRPEVFVRKQGFIFQVEPTRENWVYREK